MRTALSLVTLAAIAVRADASPDLETLYEFPGIDVVESMNEYGHEKGDSGAKIAEAHVAMRNKDGAAHEFRVKKLELLHGHCGSQKWQEHTPITVKGLESSTYDAIEPSAKAGPNDKIAVPAVKDFVWLTAKFTTMHIYNECDRFAFAIQLEVDGKLNPIELELRIKRTDPKN